MMVVVKTAAKKKQLKMSKKPAAKASSEKLPF
jgi:hypothetical protein